MVKRTLELFECDICGSEGERYQIIYGEGTRVLDRCEKHGKKLEAFKEEPGEWVSEKPGKSTFRKSSSTDVRLALARGSQRPESGAS